MLKDSSASIEDLIDENRDISFIEMGCDRVQLFCTTGKIRVWFGKQTSSELVRTVLYCFARVDSSFTHEKEIICDYERIPIYENHDYILISYGRVQGGYRAIFNIQFSKPNALNHFINSISKELEEGNVSKTFHWNGSIARIMLIYDQLHSLDGWAINRIEYREED